MDADVFEAGRDRLASLAYRLLGSAADAEDVVQDAYLRWQATDRGYVEVPEAWLTKTVANLCVDRLRSAHHRHERPVDTLPEPLLEGDPMLGPADTAVQRESVSMAVLTLMRDLTAHQRAAYVLREAFKYSHSDIAEMLDITEAASHQHLHRARARIGAGSRADREVDPDEARRVVEAFLSAAVSGRTDELVALLTDDATAVSDGAGLAAKLLELPSPQSMAAAFRAFAKPTDAKRRILGGAPALHTAVVNGSPAIIAALQDRVVAAAVFEFDGCKVAHVHSLAATSRLRRLDARWRTADHGEAVVEAW
ncbi:RNA polymerase sigma-70 factor (ECF subfamily) [Glycomyces algeriensis]|uniref:DNA-directed RNA polymerase sigma-70 factor n=2 Tax=Glycomyces algeriensis TaxID=256037 RepID=A0A9W6LFS8_9ACTN|nr:sigma-70 family RNA polymerase sigma factor [Glycomyces algeriensis]MDA1368480.1 sigma-70 family RNA polymerase sigma factor [Glycomyces algeriensis]MDR7348743.1 RNA polymerase sigma-70 factor (ECF subfamily) [Glycomyces algeriensis]GLI41445.1 DNA-directed RNA polymerase sigma-70 factor [Glycomyces algeriensis]